MNEANSNVPEKSYTKLPLVSVIIPAYNAEPFIVETLNSVLCQTYENLEILVVDDGSTDQTAGIVKSLGQQDPRIVLLKQRNQGVAAARNFAIAQSRGDYIAPLDADDLWYPQKIEKQVQKMLQSSPSVGLVYTWSVDIDEDSHIIGICSTRTIEQNAYIPLVYGNFLGNASVPLIRRSCFDTVGYYNTQLRAENAQGCEDLDLYLRIAEQYEFGVVPEFLMGYRRMGSSMSGNCAAMAKSHRLVLETVRQSYPDIPDYIYRWSYSDFYTHLTYQSFRAGRSQDVIYWATKNLLMDPHKVLHSRFMRMVFKSIVEKAHGGTSTTSPDQAWRQLKYSHPESERSLSLEELSNSAKHPKIAWWRLHQHLVARRWKVVVHHSQMLGPQLGGAKTPWRFSADHSYKCVL